jgi:succinoglycan biosynthesis protein ExoO
LSGSFDTATQDETDFSVTPCRLSPGAAIWATVVIPTYCAEATLLRAVQSALQQTLREIEVIIVDDASSDDSWRMIEQIMIEDPRVLAIRHKGNRGKPTAMNRAIAIARGRWLAVLDADDWYHDDRLAILVGIGEKWRADLVADNQFFYDGLADTVVGTAWPVGNAAWELSFDDFLLGSNAYETFNLGMLKPVLRMDFMRRTGLAYEEKARNGQDFLHMLQFYLAGGKAVIRDTPYYYYTQPFGRISHRWSHSRRKRYDFESAYQINERYLHETARNLLPHQVTHLAAHNRRIRLLEYYFRAKDAAMRGELGSALRLLTRHPAMLGYLFRRICDRFMEKPGHFITIHHIARRSNQCVATENFDAGRNAS